jgi:hypothetical protein
MTRARRNGIAILGAMAAFSLLGDYDPTNNADFFVGAAVGIITVVIATVAYLELMQD